MSQRTPLTGTLALPYLQLQPSTSAKAAKASKLWEGLHLLHHLIPSHVNVDAPDIIVAAQGGAGVLVAPPSSPPPFLTSPDASEITFHSGLVLKAELAMEPETLAMEPESKSSSSTEDAATFLARLCASFHMTKTTVLVESYCSSRNLDAGTAVKHNSTDSDRRGTSQFTSIMFKKFECSTAVDLQACPSPGGLPPLPSPRVLQVLKLVPHSACVAGTGICGFVGARISSEDWAYCGDSDSGRGDGVKLACPPQQCIGLFAPERKEDVDITQRHNFMVLAACKQLTIAISFSDAGGDGPSKEGDHASTMNLQVQTEGVVVGTVKLPLIQGFSALELTNLAEAATSQSFKQLGALLQSPTLPGLSVQKGATDSSDDDDDDTSSTDGNSNSADPVVTASLACAHPTTVMFSSKLVKRTSTRKSLMATEEALFGPSKGKTMMVVAYVPAMSIRSPLLVSNPDAVVLPDDSEKEERSDADCTPGEQVEIDLGRVFLNWSGLSHMHLVMAAKHVSSLAALFGANKQKSPPAELIADPKSAIPPRCSVEKTDANKLQREKKTLFCKIKLAKLQSRLFCTDTVPCFVQLHLTNFHSDIHQEKTLPSLTAARQLQLKAACGVDDVHLCFIEEKEPSKAQDTTGSGIIAGDAKSVIGALLSVHAQDANLSVTHVNDLQKREITSCIDLCCKSTDLRLNNNAGVGNMVYDLLSQHKATKWAVMTPGSYELASFATKRAAHLDRDKATNPGRPPKHNLSVTGKCETAHIVIPNENPEDKVRETKGLKWSKSSKTMRESKGSRDFWRKQDLSNIEQLTLKHAAAGKQYVEIRNLLQADLKRKLTDDEKHAVQRAAFHSTDAGNDTFEAPSTAGVTADNPPLPPPMFDHQSIATNATTDNPTTYHPPPTTTTTNARNSGGTTCPCKANPETKGVAVPSVSAKRGLAAQAPYHAQPWFLEPTVFSLGPRSDGDRHRG
jgi:hypothetical protein